MHVPRAFLIALLVVAPLAQSQILPKKRDRAGDIDLPSLTVPGYLNDIPTLAASIQSALITAVPASILTNIDAQCSILNGLKPDWMKTLDTRLANALTSWGSALSSWASEHAPDLATLGDFEDFPLTSCSFANKVTAATPTSTAKVSNDAVANTGKINTVTHTGVAAVATANSAIAGPNPFGLAGIAGAVGALYWIVA